MVGEEPEADEDEEDEAEIGMGSKARRMSREDTDRREEKGGTFVDEERIGLRVTRLPKNFSPSDTLLANVALRALRVFLLHFYSVLSLDPLKCRAKEVPKNILFHGIYCYSIKKVTT